MVDRTPDFQSLLKEPLSAQKHETVSTPFYLEMIHRIDSLHSQLEHTSSIKALLKVEEGFFEEQRRVREVFDAVQLPSSKSLGRHFEGIKYIVSKRLMDLSKTLRKAKLSCGSNEQYLEPERPKHYERHHRKGSAVDMKLEIENKKLAQKGEYELAQQQLMKIETVQRLIHSNLCLQEERIDVITDLSHDTRSLYKQLNSDDDFDGGSFMRRAALSIILCFAFVLLFLHYFYP